MAKKKSEAPAMVWRGNGDLQGLLKPITSLTLDPANLQIHGPRSIAGIKGALARFGQQKTIVASAAGVVRAGNGTLQAALELGWTHIAASTSDLDGAELTGYAIADNRTSQLADWDYEALATTLKEMQGEGLEVEDLGWAEHELKEMLERSFVPAAPDGSIEEPTRVELPDLGEPDSHQITISYERADEAAIRAFVRQTDDGPLSPQIGKQILGRIKELAANRADRNT